MVCLRWIYRFIPNMWSRQPLFQCEMHSKSTGIPTAWRTASMRSTNFDPHSLLSAKNAKQNTADQAAYAAAMAEGRVIIEFIDADTANARGVS